jgi:hypothetical protein
MELNELGIREAKKLYRAIFEGLMKKVEELAA